MCLFSKCNRLGFFCERSSDEKQLFLFLFLLLLLCFGPKFSDGVILLFLVICFPFRKIHALRLFHGISIERVITALVCLLFFLFFPPCGPMPLQQCIPSNEFLIAAFCHRMCQTVEFYCDAVTSEKCSLRIVDRGRRHWTETYVYNYLVKLDVGLQSRPTVMGRRNVV